jgi:hypothetical protein
MARGQVAGRKPRISADQVELGSDPPIPNEVNATLHAEPKAKRTAKTPPVKPMAYSIREFCLAHRISIDTYFRLARQGLGPVTMKAGARTLISIEAAAQWRRDRENHTSTTA